jgi:hypothetical protein
MQVGRLRVRNIIEPRDPRVQITAQNRTFVAATLAALSALTAIFSIIVGLIT